MSAAGDVWGVVTIDGPAASGKSTVARLVAERLEVPFVSSGLLYRGATYIALQGEGEIDRPELVLEELGTRDVVLIPDVDGNRLLIDNVDMTDYLHTEEVDDAVSTIAAHPPVRSWVNARLREIRVPFVVEGRDMGTVVFPEAQYKFYLTAPAEVRAQRRLGERTADLETVAAALRRRDRQDAERLARAEDARIIDTGVLTLEQVVAEVLSRIEGAVTG